MTGTAVGHPLLGSHALHAADRLWPESNCYLDVWIEQLRVWGLEPRASLAPVLTMDWEGDQFTFVKTSHADLETLYDIEVQELNVWKPLEVHVEEQVALSRGILFEVDSHWLPDTGGTTYRTGHGKTTIAIHEIDRAARRMVYSHGPGTFVVEGDDYDGLLQRRPAQQVPEVLPPFCEIAKRRGPGRQGPALAAAAVDVLRRHVARRPAVNPFHALRDAFPAHLAELLASPIEHFHLYAFATLRQAGANFALAGDHLRWLAAEGQGGFDAALAPCDLIADQSRTLQLRLARAVMTRKTPDAAPYLAALAQAWDDALGTLAAALARA